MCRGNKIRQTLFGACAIDYHSWLFRYLIFLNQSRKEGIFVLPYFSHDFLNHHNTLILINHPKEIYATIIIFNNPLWVSAIEFRRYLTDILQSVWMYLSWYHVLKEVISIIFQLQHMCKETELSFYSTRETIYIAPGNIIFYLLNCFRMLTKVWFKSPSN